ncbi:MAG: inositol monophosphatase family protein [Limisphaerales bacterium]
MAADSLLDFALHLAFVAEEQILPHYQKCSVSLKADGSEATEADRNAEAAIRQKIEKVHPDHEILGEEYGGERQVADQQWIIDPIDGTTWFTFGMPVFGSLIAYLEDGEPQLGVIHFPAMGETVYAQKGEGCWFKTRNASPTRIRVAEPVELKDATVSASGVHGSDILCEDDEIAYGLQGVIRQARKFRCYTDCLQHALVCQGSIHAGIDTRMQPWDVAALIPSVREAGGIASTLAGDRENIMTSCSDPSHEAFLEQLHAS